MLKAFRYLLIFVALIIALVVAVRLTILPSSHFPPLPNPNGFDDFIYASAATKGDPSKAFAFTNDALRDFLATNAEALRLISQGLSRKSSVPTEQWVKDFKVTDMMGLKQNAFLLAAKGQLAEQENRMDDAVESYVTLIHYGEESSRGGFFINRLIGTSSEAMGQRKLAKLVPRFSCADARPLIKKLEEIDRTRVPWSETMHAERAFQTYHFLHDGHPIDGLRELWQGRGMDKPIERKENNLRARLRLLEVELALRCYRSEHGKPPTTLSDLVPAYLQSVPQDPFNQKPLAYLSNDSSWRLYSVGQDLKDDGGAWLAPVIDGPLQKGDVFYDSPY